MPVDGLGGVLPFSMRRLFFATTHPGDNAGTCDRPPQTGIASTQRVL